MIDSYSFGRMVINGRMYSSDLIIYPDGRVEDSWWRKQGHSLVSEDITALIEKQPERIIVGTGSSGLLKPSISLARELKELGIEFTARPTLEAVESFNQESRRGKVSACFHLTC